MPICPITIFIVVDDKPSRTVKVREVLSLLRRFHGYDLLFLAYVPAFLYSPASSPFTLLSYLLLSLISFPLLSRRLDFLAKGIAVVRCQVPPMLTARGFARLALPKSKYVSF
jgi:hypothetical protein